jgi:hypothetical protein
MWQAHCIFRNLEWLKTHFPNSTSYFTNRSGLALHSVPNRIRLTGHTKTPPRPQLTTTTVFPEILICAESVVSNKYPSLPVASNTFLLTVRPLKARTLNRISYPGVLAHIKTPSRSAQPISGYLTQEYVVLNLLRHLNTNERRLLTLQYLDRIQKKGGAQI